MHTPATNLPATNRPEMNRNDLAGYQLRVTSAHRPDNFNCVAFLPHGLWLATASDDYTLRIWEVVSGRRVRTLSGHQGSVLSVAWSGDGKLLASGSYDQTVRL